jgi:hypothetical protein
MSEGHDQQVMEMELFRPIIRTYADANTILLYISKKRSK